MIVCNAREFERNPEWDDRQKPNLVSWKNKIFCFGGYDGANYFDDLWQSDKGKYWERIITAAGTMDLRGGVIFDDKLFTTDYASMKVYSWDGDITSGWTLECTMSAANTLHVIDDKRN